MGCVKVLATVGLGVLTLVAGRARADDALRVTTADGRGGDTAVSSAADAPRFGMSPELPVSFQPQAGGVSQRAYLRFDLAARSGQHVTSATLQLQPVSGAGDRWDVNVFALRELTRSSPPAIADGRVVAQDEADAKGPAALTWANAPGGDPAVGGGYVESGAASRFPGADADAVEYLGRITATTGGGTARLTGKTLADLLNADTDGFVTLLVTRADPGRKPVTFASKEHAAFDPPTLTLDVTPEPRRAAADRLLERPVQWGGQARQLAAVWRDVERAARKQRSWQAVLPDAEKFVRAVDAAAGPPATKGDEPARTPAGDLARLLRLEVSLRAKRVDEAAWAKSSAEIFNARPDDGPALVLAFLALANWRTVDGSSFAIAPADLTPWIKAGVPDAVRFEIGREREYARLTVAKEPPQAASFYRRLLPAPDGYGPDPYVLNQYAQTLAALRGPDAAAMFLDEVVATMPDRRAGVAAALQRIHGEADPAAKACLVIDAVQRNPGSPLAATLRTRYLAIMAERGALAAGLARVDPEGEKSSSTTSPRDRAAPLRKLVTDVSSPTAFDYGGADDFPHHPLGGPSPSAFSLLHAVAEEDWGREQYAVAAEVAFEALRARGVRLPELASGQSAATLDALLPGAAEGDPKETAGLLLGMCALEAGRPDEGLARLEAAAASKAAPVKAYAMFCLAKRQAERDGAAAAAEPAHALAEMMPDSPAARALNEAASAAVAVREEVARSAAAVDAELQAATKEPDAEKSQLAYLRAAEAAASIGHTERAVAIYDALLRHHPKGGKAKDALTRCVELLTSGSTAADRERADRYRKALERQFGTRDGKAAPSPSPAASPATR